MRALHARRYQLVAACTRPGCRSSSAPTPAGRCAHGRIADEAAELVRAGIPDRDVVAAASWRTRAWLGAEGLDEGASADLVVFDARPA